MEPIISKLAHSYVDADDLNEQLRRLFNVRSFPPVSYQQKCKS